MNSSIPGVNQAYVMAIQEDSQRKLGLVHKGNEPLTILAGQNQSYSSQSGQGKDIILSTLIGIRISSDKTLKGETTLRHKIIKERNQEMFVKIVVTMVMSTKIATELSIFLLISKV